MRTVQPYISAVPDERYIDDVANLARAMVSDPAVQQMFVESEHDASGDQLTVLVHLNTDDLGKFTTALRVVQLAVDAAVVAAEYLADPPDKYGYERGAFLRTLVSEFGQNEVVISSIERGTWHIKLTFDPGTDSGRKWLAAVGVLLGAGITCVGVVAGPALIIGGTIIGAVGGVVGIISKPDGTPAVVTPVTVDATEIPEKTRVIIDMDKAA